MSDGKTVLAAPNFELYAHYYSNAYYCPAATPLPPTLTTLVRTHLPHFTAQQSSSPNKHHRRAADILYYYYYYIIHVYSAGLRRHYSVLYMMHIHSLETILVRQRNPLVVYNIIISCTCHNIGTYYTRGALRPGFVEIVFILDIIFAAAQKLCCIVLVFL